MREYLDARRSRGPSTSASSKNVRSALGPDVQDDVSSTVHRSENLDARRDIGPTTSASGSAADALGHYVLADIASTVHRPAEEEIPVTREEVVREPSPRQPRKRRRPRREASPGSVAADERRFDSALDQTRRWHERQRNFKIVINHLFANKRRIITRFSN